MIRWGFTPQSIEDPIVDFDMRSRRDPKSGRLAALHVLLVRFAFDFRFIKVPLSQQLEEIF